MSDMGPTGVPESTFDSGQFADPADDIASPYLQSIPEVDRNVVAKYLKGWQGGVTKRFQAIHDQYRPYKQYGSPEDVGNYQAFYNLMNESPMEMLKWMSENIPEVTQFFTGIMESQGQGQRGPQGQPSIDNPWADSGLPDEFVQQFQQQGQILQALAERVLSGEASGQEAQEDAELDDLIEQMHEAFGDFDEDAVLLRMYNGAEPQEAFEDWNNSMQEQVNLRTSQRPPPFVMGGNGSVPQGGVDPSKLNAQDRMDYVAKMLTAARDSEV